jgi:predicted TIM-barrel fold metal-dependent hydrolase
VLNHTGLPSADDPSGWRAAMAGLAACPNVVVKISGMGVPVRKFVLGALGLFGTERAMFASNYPVDSLRASFDTLYSGFEALTRGLPEAQRRALFHDNAVRIYRME